MGFHFRQAADYGGILNALLCVVHCAAGPLILLWWGSQAIEATAASWELGFLGLSGVFVVLATRKRSTARLRLALWLLFAVFAASSLLAERWPALEMVQYAASAGLIGGHLLNQRFGRGCKIDSFTDAPAPTAA